MFKVLRHAEPDSLVGVPGDMNLQLLDYIEDMPEITWGVSPNTWTQW